MFLTSALHNCSLVAHLASLASHLLMADHFFCASCIDLAATSNIPRDCCFESALKTSETSAAVGSVDLKDTKAMKFSNGGHEGFMIAVKGFIRS